MCCSSVCLNLNHSRHRELNEVVLKVLDETGPGIKRERGGNTPLSFIGLGRQTNLNTNLREQGNHLIEQCNQLTQRTAGVEQIRDSTE